VNDIKSLLYWAKSNLKGKTITLKSFNQPIRFTTKGIKEYLNQPHQYYHEKNELIKNIEDILKESEYKGVTHHKGKCSHIFEITINRHKSWIIANENEGREIAFYSISDNEKVMTEIKK
jgi:hypothetical protein